MSPGRLTMRRLYHVLQVHTGNEFAIRDVMPHLPGFSQRVVTSAVQRFKDRGLLVVGRLVKNRQSRYALFVKTELFFLGLEHAAALSSNRTEVQENPWSYQLLEDAFRGMTHRRPKRILRVLVADTRKNKRVRKAARSIVF